MNKQEEQSNIEAHPPEQLSAQKQLFARTPEEEEQLKLDESSQEYGYFVSDKISPTEHMILTKLEQLVS